MTERDEEYEKDLAEQRAIGIALVHWIKSQDLPEETVIKVLGRTLGMTIGVLAVNKELLEEGIKIVAEIITLQAVATFNKRNSSE